MNQLTASELIRTSVADLGFDPDYVDFSSTEVIAEAVRRAASLRSPLPRAALKRAVLEPLLPLLQQAGDLPNQVHDVIDELLGLGDLVERSIEHDGSDRKFILLGMPRFVVLGEGTIAIVGCRPDAVPMLNEDLTSLIDFVGGGRFVSQFASYTDDIGSVLRSEGLVELQLSDWVGLPAPADADDYLNGMRQRVQSGLRAHGVAITEVFDPSTRSTYYRGRWRSPRPSDSGLTLVRRPQAYGSDFWSLADFQDGSPVRLTDLPTDADSYRGCDEAWRIMAAMDSSSGSAQSIILSDHVNGRTVLSLFSPPPSWVQRTLAHLASPLPRVDKALLSYSLPFAVVDEVVRTLETTLWVTCEDTRKAKSK